MIFSPKVSVVICSKNEERFIGNCLNALSNQSMKPEIIIVDGHSSDRTVEIAKPYVDKIVMDDKIGISNARNIGWKTARGDIVAYCDADSIPTRNWVRNLSKFMGNNVCIYGPIYPYDGGTSTKINLKIWGDLFFRLTSAIKKPFLCGANFAFKRSVFKKIRFRENVPILEDTDIADRITKLGQVGFFKELHMGVSSRRYENNFYRTAVKHYIPNYIRLKTGRRLKENGYFDYW